MAATLLHRLRVRRRATGGRGDRVKLVYNERLPSEIREALHAEAKRRDVKVNDVAGEAIARFFGDDWQPSGAPYRNTDARIDKIKVPDKLHRKIRAAALRVPGGTGTMRGVVLAILADSLELGITVSRVRRPRRETVGWQAPWT